MKTWLLLVPLLACREPAPRAPTPEHLARVHGYDLAEAGDWQSALACFEDAGDLEDQANALGALGRYDEEALLRARLLDGDPLTMLNLGCALHDAGYPARAWIEDAAARAHACDPALARALSILAMLTLDPEPAAELRHAAEEYDHARS